MIPFPDKGRLGGVDFGTARIGVAVCDPDRRLSSPLAVRARGGEAADAAYFRKVAKEERLVGWVVGLPIHSDGKESESSARCRLFARWLRQVTALPTRLFDERFTTNVAQSRLNTRRLSRSRQKQRLDAIAAQVLLEAFLEAAELHPNVPPGIPADGGGEMANEAID